MADSALRARLRRLAAQERAQEERSRPTRARRGGPFFFGGPSGDHYDHLDEGDRFDADAEATFSNLYGRD